MNIRKFLHTRPGMLAALILIVLAQLSEFVLPSSISDIGAVFITIAVLFVYAWLRGTGPAEFGLQRPESWSRTVFWGIVYAAVAFCLFRITLEPLLERWIGVARDMSRFESLRGNLPKLAMLLVIMWIMAALYEELFFRGFLIPTLSSLMKNSTLAVTAAVAISASYFALNHIYQGITGIIYTGLAAVFLSAVYLGHRRNLWITIIAHGLFDTSGMLFFYFGIYKKIVHCVF